MVMAWSQPRAVVGADHACTTADSTLACGSFACCLPAANAETVVKMQEKCGAVRIGEADGLLVDGSRPTGTHCA
jgi:hypothetical protein